MNVAQPPDLLERGAGGFWSMPAFDFLTTGANQDFSAVPYAGAGGKTFPFARGVRANADVTFNLTRIGGGAPQAFTMKDGTEQAVFFQAIDTVVGGTVTVLF